MLIKRFINNSYKAYKKLINKAFNKKNLIFTNVLLSVGISTTGDLLEQCFELYHKEIDDFDPKRTAHMGFSGMTAGIICHHWYMFLDKVITGRTIDMVVKKLMLDQFICSPIVIMSFFATIAIFEENPFESFSEEVTEKFWVLYRAEWYVWPPAQVINFYLLPTKYRVLYDNTISLGYDIYTSQIKHSRFRKHSDDKKEE
ncbi:mpv17-like protein 2 isoform X2 [Leptidea sinapis]|uniref:Mpv17-like protein 2 n=1 Tax=Leptidea sinapis TaxID=189913 RepID=A0A5E4QZU5_9NEOP|nr:mpv17-like protein 2 isoform X2 [Leptidea sinapis]VVD03228.1 unnamed protein product [Leptidea sinapis]